jgi:hypothetical protein
MCADVPHARSHIMFIRRPALGQWTNWLGQGRTCPMLVGVRRTKIMIVHSWITNSGVATLILDSGQTRSDCLHG